MIDGCGVSMLLLNSNAVKIPLADESVHCVVTSPPYWNLRDYGTARWEGGNSECDHLKPPTKPRSNRPNPSNSGIGKGGPTWEEQELVSRIYLDTCQKCNAIRIDNQLGLEPTIEAYVSSMVAVFREVWRVLHRTGQLFLNISDTRTKDRQWCGIPHRLVFALQEDGWRYEDEIVWSKTNPMPGSQTNRFTRAHEFMFMLNKSKDAFFDLDAVREAHTEVSLRRAEYEKRRTKSEGWKSQILRPTMPANEVKLNPAGRARRSVWTIPTAPYSGAHFATFPPALVEPCIKAGSSEHGVCPECGAGWERVVEKPKPPGEMFTNSRGIHGASGQREWGNSKSTRGSGQKYQNWLNENPATTTGWQPTCTHIREGDYYWCPDCDITRHIDHLKRGCPECGETMIPAPHEQVPAIIFDPFCGSGTTLLVARKLGRRAIGLDLSFEYLHDQAKTRLGLTALEEWETGKNGKGAIDDLPLFMEKI